MPSQSSIPSLTHADVHSLMSVITIRLGERNFIKWSFQFQSTLAGNGLFGYYDGTDIAPPRYVLNTEGEVLSEESAAYKAWKQTDMALLSLLMATLDEEIVDVIIGCKSSHQAWLALQGLRTGLKNRPDIAYAVNTVCQFMTSPTEVHYAAVKRILRYLKGTLQKGLFFRSNGASMNSVFVKAFCDADWAGEIIQRRSTTGFVVYIGSSPVSWQSKKQGTVSRSSTESEYRSLANTAAEVSWIRHLLCDLKIQIPHAPVLKCDNLSALALASNPVFHSRIKHLDNDFHFVRERVQHNDLKLEYVSTKEQTADILTKGLPSPLFHHHCVNLRLVTRAEIEGG